METLIYIIESNLRVKYVNEHIVLYVFFAQFLKKAYDSIKQNL